MKNVTIIGGGTAGWISAMFISSKISDTSVTLVESKTIGIVGVGEGTTPNIKSFLMFIFGLATLSKNCHQTEMTIYCYQ